ncbi:MAG: hypothetical protein QOE28_310 [Solirubrobacteraceae bacterium]|jgi:hypothetical protein|nr:hypothetical protein [Solirubrobacteraceae bacterium]
MNSRRKLATTAAVAMAALSLSAGPALAKSPKASFSYFATIDCGAGPVQVGSGDDLWAPLVDLGTGKAYQPVAWHVSVDGMSIDATTKGATKKHAVDCSYSDGVATGIVTVKKA